MRSAPSDNLAGDARWSIIAKLLRDPAIEVADRVAGSFVLLYAQPLSRIAVMTVDAVTVNGASVSVRFGTQAVIVPAPLSDHVKALINTGRQGWNIGLHQFNRGMSIEAIAALLGHRSLDMTLPASPTA